MESRDAKQTKQPQQQLRQLPTPSSREYRVRRGDTLIGIAWRAEKNFRDIAQWNAIRKPYVIYAGQVLRLSAPKKTKPIVSTAKVKKRPVKKSAEKPLKPVKPPRPNKVDSNKVEKKPQAVTKAVSGKKHLRWQWPAKGKVVSTFKSGDRLRKGLKIKGKPGQKITAAEAGKVVYSGSGLIGYGKLIIIKHNDNILSAYGHNRKLLAQQGQHVTKGQKIAELGTANDGEALLHFEIRHDGVPVDPLRRLPRR